MASMLNPPLSEEELVEAMIGNFPPEAENSMICGNLKTAQEALTFLSRMQELETTRLQHTRPRREMTLHTMKARIMLRLETQDMYETHETIPSQGVSH